MQRYLKFCTPDIAKNNRGVTRMTMVLHYSLPLGSTIHSGENPFFLPAVRIDVAAWY